MKCFESDSIKLHMLIYLQTFVYIVQTVTFDSTEEVFVAHFLIKNNLVKFLYNSRFHSNILLKCQKKKCRPKKLRHLNRFMKEIHVSNKSTRRHFNTR